MIGDPAQGVGRIARPRADTPGRVGAPRDPAKPALDPARRNWRAGHGPRVRLTVLCLYARAQNVLCVIGIHGACVVGAPVDSATSNLFMLMALMLSPYYPALALLSCAGATETRERMMRARASGAT